MCTTKNWIPIFLLLIFLFEHFLFLNLFYIMIKWMMLELSLFYIYFSLAGTFSRAVRPEPVYPSVQYRKYLNLDSVRMN